MTLTHIRWRSWRPWCGTISCRSWVTARKARKPDVAPRTWVILSDKRGDNGQVDTIVEALPWPVEHKYVHMKPECVLGKPRYRPSLDHLDLVAVRSHRRPLAGPDSHRGRRPSMVALWMRQQSANQTKIVLVGKPSGHMLDFSLVVASAENQMPPCTISCPPPCR